LPANLPSPLGSAKLSVFKKLIRASRGHFGTKARLYLTRVRANPKKKLLHNARSETITHLPSFREAVQRRRCLIPANGFYESVTQGQSGRPFVFMLKDEEPFAIAGIWEPGLDESLPPVSAW
jgi:putative SOS response-associated peptidase YedK